MNITKKCEKQAKILKALGNPVRLYIVKLLFEKERCVNYITEKIGYKMSSVSRHLSVLIEAGILKKKKDGQNIYYSLVNKCFFREIAIHCGLCEKCEFNKKC